MSWPTMVPASMGSSPAYSKLRPFRGSRVGADHGAIKKCRLGIEAGRRTESGGKQRGIAAFPRGHPDADRGIGHVDGRNAQPVDSGHETGAFVRSGRNRRAWPHSAPTRAVNELDLLIERHLRDEHVGALVGWQRFVHPGALDLWTFGGLAG